MILGYEITLYTNHAAAPELFKDKNLTASLHDGSLLYEYKNFPQSSFIHDRSYVVADLLSRNAQVGAVRGKPLVINFSLYCLCAAQRKHDIWYMH